jgi:hypothetical protein
MGNGSWLFTASEGRITILRIGAGLQGEITFVQIVGIPQTL